MKSPSGKCGALEGARLLDVTERSPRADGLPLRDSRPSLVFDKGVLTVENPFMLSCDSGEAVDWRSMIGCCVTDTFSTQTDFYVVFDGRLSLRVSLKEQDFIGPYAASFRALAGDVVIVR